MFWPSIHLDPCHGSKQPHMVRNPPDQRNIEARIHRIIAFAFESNRIEQRGHGTSDPHPTPAEPSLLLDNEKKSAPRYVCTADRRRPDRPVYRKKNPSAGSPLPPMTSPQSSPTPLHSTPIHGHRHTMPRFFFMRGAQADSGLSYSGGGHSRISRVSSGHVRRSSSRDSASCRASMLTASRRRPL